MAERDYDDYNEALDPELLYTKEYCIGLGPFFSVEEGGMLTLSMQEGVALVKSIRGMLFFERGTVRRSLTPAAKS